MAGTNPLPLPVPSGTYARHLAVSNHWHCCPASTGKDAIAISHDTSLLRTAACWCPSMQKKKKPSDPYHPGRGRKSRSIHPSIRLSLTYVVTQQVVCSLHAEKGKKTWRQGEHPFRPKPLAIAACNSLLALELYPSSSSEGAFSSFHMGHGHALVLCLPDGPSHNKPANNCTPLAKLS